MVAVGKMLLPWQQLVRCCYHGFSAHLTLSTVLTALLTLCKCPLLSEEDRTGEMDRTLDAVNIGKCREWIQM